MGIKRLLLLGCSRPVVTCLAFEQRWTLKKRRIAQCKSVNLAQHRLEQNVEPEEQVVAFKVLDRVECLEGRD